MSAAKGRVFQAPAKAEEEKKRIKKESNSYSKASDTHWPFLLADHNENYSIMVNLLQSDS